MTSCRVQFPFSQKYIKGTAGVVLVK